MSGERLGIAASGWRVELLPDTGGALLALSHFGRDVLRPTSGDPKSPTDTACFPMVPYANRIDNGRFRHAGVDHVLPRNFGDHPHSIHGIGWLRPWRVVTHDASSVRLEHRHDGGDAWPWPYRAEQTVSASAEGCRIALSITNDSDETVPAGLGLHPYFPAHAVTRLTARADRLWLTDATMLPTRTAPADHFGNWAKGATVAGGTLIDNAYEGWDGAAQIDDGGVVHVVASGARAFQLYRPPNAGYFCFEPVSHLPDAINRNALPVDLLTPGATLHLEMGLSLEIR